MLSLSLAPAIVLTALATGLQEAPAKAERHLLPPLGSAIQLKSDGDTVSSMEQFVRAYEAASGATFIRNEQTAAILQQSPLGFERMPEMTLSEQSQFFQATLRYHDFCLTPVASNLGLVGIESLRTDRRSQVRSDSTMVDSDDVAFMRANPAFLFTTVVELENLDVRQLSNSMRSMITDANTTQMLPAGNTNSMVIQAFGDHLAELVEQFEMINAASAAKAEPAPSEDQLRLIRLQYANAGDLRRTLDNLQPRSTNSDGEKVPARVRIAEDSRTNSLLLSGPSSELEALAGIIASLDVNLAK